MTKDEDYGLFSSIKNVRLPNCAIKEGNNMHFLNERAFAYELYHQWTLNLPCDNLIVSAEVSKKINDQYKSKAQKVFGRKIHRFLPDMVLHRSNDVNEDMDQMIICEIKVNKVLTRKSLLKDLRKLIAYTDQEKKAILYHPFKLGVFILLDGCITEIGNLINEKDLSNEDVSKIICVSVNIVDGKIKLVKARLADVMKRTES